MKFHLDQLSGTYLITGHGPGFIDVNKQRREHGFVILPDRVIEPWAKEGFAGLLENDFAGLAELGTTITLIGTGLRQRFPPLALLRPLITAQRGFEIMDTAAACRTYNILVSEGRSVCAALILETPA